MGKVPTSDWEVGLISNPSIAILNTIKAAGEAPTV